jgi:Cu/Ag efflux pump CusA
LGYAIAGGVLLSTALTLYLVPVVYSLLDRVFVRRAVSRPAEPAAAVPGDAG